MNKFILCAMFSVLLTGCGTENVSINANQIITPGEIDIMKSWCASNKSQLSYVAIVWGIDSFNSHGKMAVCDNGLRGSLKSINRVTNNAPQ